MMARIGFWTGMALGAVGSVMLLMAPETKKLMKHFKERM